MNERREELNEKEGWKNGRAGCRTFVGLHEGCPVLCFNLFVGQIIDLHIQLKHSVYTVSIRMKRKEDWRKKEEKK